MIENYQRKIFIDIAKGLGIIFVIMGHSGFKNFNLFHMPFFFIISGFFLSDKLTMKEYTIKRAKQLLYPYIFCCILCIFSAMLSAILKKNHIYEILLNVYKWIVAGVAVKSTNTNVNYAFFNNFPRIGAVWFLVALFYASIINRKYYNSKYLPIITFIFAFIGLETAKISLIPFCIQQGMVASFFLTIGRSFKEYKIFDKKPDVLITCLSILLSIFAYKYSITNRFATATFRYGFLSIITSTAITYIILWLCILIEKYIPYINRIFAFIGKNSLIILIFHCWEISFIKWNKIISNFGITVEGIKYCLLVTILRILLCFLCLTITLKTPLKKIFGK